MSVVPVSIAESAELPVFTETGDPLAVIPRSRLARSEGYQARKSLVSPSNQNEGGWLGIVKNSISPVCSVSFIPPSVKTPPFVISGAVLSVSLLSQKDISVVVRALLFARLNQNGLARVLASGVHARPIIPETGASIRLSVSCDTPTIRECQK